MSIAVIYNLYTLPGSNLLDYQKLPADVVALIHAVKQDPTCDTTKLALIDLTQQNQEEVNRHLCDVFAVKDKHPALRNLQRYRVEADSLRRHLKWAENPD